jgi:hypothetical protein
LEISKRQNRSFLAVTNLEKEIAGEDSLFNVLMEIKNTGNTPAYNVKINCSMMCRFYENRIRIEELEENIFTIPINYISAGQTIILPQSSNMSLANGEHKSFMKGGQDLYIFIKVQYSDIDSIEHTTRALRHYNYPLKKFIYCYNYNDAN